MNCFVFANSPESDDPRSLEAVAAFPRALGNHLHLNPPISPLTIFPLTPTFN